jgi:hypothetical protein
MQSNVQLYRLNVATYSCPLSEEPCGQRAYPLVHANGVDFSGIDARTIDLGDVEG